MITAGRYRLLFDDDANLAARPQIDHARHGTAFVTNTDSFRIAGPEGTCWASRQCALVGLNRSGVYHRLKGESAATLALMRLINEAFMEHPFYGARQMMLHLRRRGHRLG